MATLTEETLASDLRALGIAPGDLLILHSSYKSLGAPCSDGAATLLSALTSVLGEAGTLVLPCFTLPADTVNVLTTPCCLGYIPETFRTLPGVLVSNNHTHRIAARGPLAQRLVAAHQGTSPLGRGSPLHEAARLGAKVLMLGCSYTSCSLVHVAEALARLPFAGAQIACEGYDRAMTLVRTDGAAVQCPPLDSPGDPAAFGKVEAELQRCGLLRQGAVAAAQCSVARGNDILCAALDLLAGDPLALLCSREQCSVCQRKRRFDLLVKVKKFVQKKMCAAGPAAGGGGGGDN
jgi:aminoglycoside 3-N-acetyltransferase